MAKRQFCQLAHVWNPKKHFIAGQFLSEKLDGQRAIWDGGVTRGLFKDEVPYANTYKDERFKQRQVATGLWSRYGNVIHAPDWFLDQFPLIPLDLELYAGRKQFQFVQSTVRDLVTNDGNWQQIAAVVLDSPPPTIWLADGVINERNCKVTMHNCLKWWVQHGGSLAGSGAVSTFETRLRALRRLIEPTDNLQVHDQIELPFNPTQAHELIDSTLSQITAEGGEGLVIKKRSSLYTVNRSHDVLKVKPCNDSEATVIGYYWGAEADNSRSTTGQAVGKYLGLMGSLLVEWQGKQFKLSGFTDQERFMDWIPEQRINESAASEYGRQAAGEVAQA
jgi:hypothetical protein